MCWKLVAVLCLLAASALWAAPCATASLDVYLGLAAGCSHQGGTFSNFVIEPGAAFATPVDPAGVTVTPGASATGPWIAFSFTQSLFAGQVSQLFLHFSATFPTLGGAGIELAGSSATGDGAVTGGVDICPGGSFDPGAPTGCPVSSEQLLTAVMDGFDSLTDQRPMGPSSFFDIFVDITVDGGLNGAASGAALRLDLETGGSQIPEPSTLVLCAGALGLIGLCRRRR